MALKGKRAFNDYYKDALGFRWEEIKRSFSCQPRYLELKKNLLQPYYIDEASVAAAEALDVREGDEVLDICAAPGGKTLVLAGLLAGRGNI